MGKKKHRQKPHKTARRMPAEDRRTEAITVAWMLCTMVTFGALVFAGIAALAVPRLASRAGDVGALGVIPGLLLAIATVIGSVAIILMGITIRIRRSPPPRLIIAGSIVICFVPFGVHVLLAWISGAS